MCREDVFPDLLVQRTFAFLNRQFKPHGWFLPTYRVLPLTPESGLVEVVHARNTAYLNEKDLEQPAFLPSFIGTDCAEAFL